MKIEALVFDWGDTIMRDFNLPGPMWKWPVVEWVDGAHEVLKILSEKYCCIIATSADHSDTYDMIKALKRLDADRYFRYFFSQKEIGCQKPDPLFFQEVVHQAGFRPEHCVMIGNLYHKDIVGAKAIGMRTILLDESKSQTVGQAVDFIIHHMTELFEILT